ncbi:DNA helicase ROCK-N-ROLLERS [Perilla frutescens var. hirtella]|nr:DNA helicase ROCK-N-ROLLERS [Perilla frutescens var. hirtella]
MSLDGARTPGAADGRPEQSQSGHANGSINVPVLQNGAAAVPPTYLTHRLRLNPNSDHRPDNYEDLDLEFSPSLFSSLERYLPPNLLQQARDVKVNYMREILLRYYPESERIRLQKHREYRQKIISNYQRLHVELYNMHPTNFFMPSFLKAISENTEQAFRNLMSEPSPGIFTFEMLQPRFCEMLLAEVENFEKWVHETKFRIMRPNTMNKYGAVLDDFGMETMLDKLMEDFIRPLSKVFFPEVGGSNLDSHHGFVLEYGIDRDVDLGFHVDDSEVTLNVCLGKQFSGGELFFRGVRCGKHVNTETQSEEIFDYSHVPGRAVLHRGRHRHGARATTSGNRINLLLWCRSSVFRESRKYQRDFSSWCAECQREKKERQRQSVANIKMFIRTSSHMDTYALKAVTDLPAPFRSVFNFRYFNSLQSECFSTCYLSDVNMVISAPTGSGKTVLFELCIMRLLSNFITGDQKFTLLKGTLKTIYIAPSKALVQEKLRHWTQRFGTLGIDCLELTGDNEYYSVKSMQDADIILTTPEKFDAVSRYRIKDGGLSFFSDISLVLIDEVHLLNDPRGAALEAIVSRIKMLACNLEMKSSPLSRVRFLAVSATIPNISDLAEWLMVPTQGIKKFGEEMRPVKLTTKVFGYTPAKNDFLFEKRLQNYIFDLLMQFSGGKSALIFCSTRKGAQEAAQRLSQIAMTFGHSNPFIKSREQQERLREASLSCSDKQMQSYIIYGVGYHNGGLSMKDRNLIEGLFLNGDLRILCTTNTLAHGINLPAHTVVIKSTQYFNKEKGMYMEYERSMILQMCGRAGRPPFDDTGMVIIMTRKETVHLYENLLGGCEMVESQLLPCVTEHLTAEIVQSTVSDITRVIEWMKCSYLYVRMKKNPENYSIKGLSCNRIEKHLQEICVQKVNELSKYQMVWTDEDGFLLKPLEPGRLMTKYYLKFDTMKHIIQAPTNCSIEETLRTICKAEEIAWIQLRRNEKKLLNDINNDKDGRLHFHILDDKGKRKKRIQTREEKIFVLVNDCLTGDPVVRDLSMTQDTNSICSNGSRIAKCMKEYFLYKKSYKGALNSTLLTKCLYQKLWDDSPYLLKQLPGIGMVTAKALHSMGVTSFDTLSEADPRKIEMATGRKYPFGNHIKESLLSLPPKIEMTVAEPEVQRTGKSKLLITLTRLSDPVQSTKRHYADAIVGVEEDNLILFHEKIRLEDFSSPYHATVLFSSPEQGKLTIKADLIFEEFIGIDLHQKVIVRPPRDTNAISKFRQKELSSFIPKDCTSLPLSNELMEKFSMPSFKLIDEESEEEIPVAETEDDDCKIITERTVFDHIREKAKSLPFLPRSNDTVSPSLEAFTLIKKRTREMHLELDNDYNFEVLEIQGSYRIPQSRTAFEHPRLTETEQEMPIIDEYSQMHIPDSHTSSHLMMNAETWNGEGAAAAEYFNTKTGTSAEEIISEHARKKPRNFLFLDSLKKTDPALVTVGNATSHTKEKARSAHVSMPNDDIRLSVGSGGKLLSPSLQKRQVCSLSMAQGKKENSFLGFQSVFSFL